MTAVQILPYIEPPKQVTATAQVQSLGEHYLAFLCENNRSGFTQEQIQEHASQMMRYLEWLSTRVIIEKSVLHTSMKRIQGFTEKMIKVSRIYELIARALGYSSHNEMIADNPGNTITVKRNPAIPLSLQTLVAEREKKKYRRPDMTDEQRAKGRELSQMLLSIGMINIHYELREYVKIRSPELATHPKFEGYLSQAVGIFRYLHRVDVIPREELRELMKKVDLLLHPALTNGRVHQLVAMAMGYNTFEDMDVVRRCKNKKLYYNAWVIFGK